MHFIFYVAKVRQKHNPETICALRTRYAMLQHMMDIRLQPTEKQRRKKRKAFGLREDENPLLSIPADL